MNRSPLSTAFLLAFVAMASFSASAQNDIVRPYIPLTSPTGYDNPPPPVSQQQLDDDTPDMRVRLGTRAAIAFTRLHLTDPALDVYTNHSVLHGAGGVFAHIPLLGNSLAIRPTLAFASRGGHLTYDDVDYRLRADYWDFRLPVVYRLPLRGDVAPYFLAAPHYDLATGGRIAYSDAETPNGLAVDATTANLKGSDAGLLLGAGVEWRVGGYDRPVYLMLEACYNIGMSNTFSKRERADATATSAASIGNNHMGATLWHGSRYNRGWELALQVAIPIGKRKAAASPNEPSSPLQHTTADTVYLRTTDTVYIIRTDTVVTLPPDQYRLKDVYTVAEIFDFIERGVDISDKRIIISNINFNFDSYTLSFDSEETLLQLLRLMNTYPEMEIAVYGHTDSRGSDRYNRVLSESRAGAVATYLVGHGISPLRIRTYGFGKEFPLMPGDSEEAHRLNRRVEIEVTRIGQRIKR